VSLLGQVAVSQIISGDGSDLPETAQSINTEGLTWTNVTIDYLGAVY